MHEANFVLHHDYGQLMFLQRLLFRRFGDNIDTSHGNKNWHLDYVRFVVTIIFVEFSQTADLHTYVIS